MGGFCNGGSSQIETRSTGSASGTQTRGSSPRPQPRPDTSSPVYRVNQAVSTATSNLARDVSMGATTFGRSEAAGNAALSAAGYSQEEIQKYRDRTAATQESNRQAEAQAAAMREQGRSMQDQPQRTTSAMTPRPSPEEPTPAPIPIVPGSPEDTSGQGPAETAVVEEAKKKTGYAGTIETTPSGLMTAAKTRKRRSLMGGLIA